MTVSPPFLVRHLCEDIQSGFFSSLLQIYFVVFSYMSVCGSVCRCVPDRASVLGGQRLRIPGAEVTANCEHLTQMLGVKLSTLQEESVCS